MYPPYFGVDLFVQTLGHRVGGIDLKDLADCRLGTFELARLEGALAVLQQFVNVNLLDSLPGGFQLQQHFFHVLVACIGLFCQHAVHDGLHIRRSAGSSLGEGARFFQNDVGH